MLQQLSEGYYEDKNHGSESFPFNIYPCSIPVDFNSVLLHWQQSMEIIFIKKGSGLVQIGIDVFEAKLGDIFIIPPGTLHALRSIPDQIMEYENFLFDLKFLGLHTLDKCAHDYLIPLSRGQIKFPSLLRKGHSLYNNIEYYLVKTEELCKNKNNGYELGVKANMMQILYQLFQSTNDTSHQQENSNRLTNILILVEDNFAQPISIEEAS